VIKTVHQTTSQVS